MRAPPSSRLAVSLIAAAGMQLAAATELAATPALELLPETLEFTAEEGQSGPVSPRTVLMFNAGDSELAKASEPEVVYGSTPDWLEVVPSGTGNGQALRNSVDISGLTPRTYGATVEVASAGATGSPRSYSVTLVVKGDPDSQSGPVIEVAPTRVEFEVRLGGAGQATSGMVRVALRGGGVLGAVETDVSYSQGADWLTVSAAEAGEGQQLRNTVSGAGMQPGTYAATVDVSVAGASNSPQSYVVFLTVTNQLGDGGRSSDPDALPDAGPGGSGAGLASRTLAGGCTMARAGTPRDARHWPTLLWLITVVSCASFCATRCLTRRLLAGHREVARSEVNSQP